MVEYELKFLNTWINLVEEAQVYFASQGNSGNYSVNAAYEIFKTFTFIHKLCGFKIISVFKKPLCSLH